jgi:RNAse (barnase) inhibitor barstar
MILTYNNIPAVNTSDNNMLSVLLDGTQLTTIDLFYAAIKTALSLPDYFGNNLDALADSITDLSHLTQKEISIVLKHQDDFLKEEDEETKKGVLETLTFSVDELDMMHEQDEFADHPTVYFYIPNNQQNTAFLEEASIPFEEI